MNIHELLGKIKHFGRRGEDPSDIRFDEAGEPVQHEFFKKFFLSILIILVALLAFGVGRLTAGQGSPGVTISSDVEALESTSTSQVEIPQASPGNPDEVYASSKGTRYYYDSCHSSVSDANKITFATAGAAEAAGYTLAANCHKPD